MLGIIVIISNAGYLSALKEKNNALMSKNRLNIICINFVSMYIIIIALYNTYYKMCVLQRKRTNIFQVLFTFYFHFLLAARSVEKYIHSTFYEYTGCYQTNFFMANLIKYGNQGSNIYLNTLTYQIIKVGSLLK